MIVNPKLSGELTHLALKPFTYHGAMEIRFALLRVGEQGKLGNTEYIAVDVYHAAFPHLTGGICEDLQLKASSVNLCTVRLDRVD